MSYGFQLLNNGGDIVIDGEHPCIFLHEKGRKTVSCPRGNGEFWRGTSSPNYAHGVWRTPGDIVFTTRVTTQEPPFVLAHAEGTPLCMGPLVGTPGNWTGFRCTIGASFYRGSNNNDLYLRWDGLSASATVNYAVFSRTGAFVSPSTHGAVAYNRSGVSIFDSRKFPFILDGPFNYRRFGEYGFRETPSRSRLGNGISSRGQELHNYFTNVLELTTPSPHHWPLLSGLNQTLYVSSDSKNSYLQYYWKARNRAASGGAIVKLCVQRVAPTRWRYSFRPVFDGTLDDRPIMSDQVSNQPNYGGGLGSPNLLVFGRVPP